jgi:glyoxylase-like metal-dependent hydrolase (beta-lactamase superfamily II)
LEKEVIFNTTGEVVDGFHVLGSRATPCYMADGERPLLFDAGFTFLGPAYVQGIRALLGERTPYMLFLTHSHFDHCGAAAYLQEEFPGMKLAASAKAAKVFSRPRAVELMTKLNQDAASGYWSRLPLPIYMGRFKPPRVDVVLEPGQLLEPAEGLNVQVIGTPGHTWDFLSYYLPERKILVASEAVGCAHFSGNIVSEFLVDYQAYVDSIKLLARLEVEVLCQGHHMVYTGPDARDHFTHSLQAAQEFHDLIVDLLHKERGDITRVMDRVRALEYEPAPEPKQPLSAYLINLEARVRHLAKTEGFLPE